MTTLSVGAVALFTIQTMRTALFSELAINLQGLAVTRAQAVADLLDKQVDLLQSFALSKVVQDAAEAASNGYQGDLATIRAAIEMRNRQWTTAPDADPIIQTRLQSGAASELREYQNTFPDTAELFMTDRYGAVIAMSARTAAYNYAEATWWQAAYNGGQGAVAIEQPQYDDRSGAPRMIIALPLFGHGTHTVVGIVHLAYDLHTLTRLLAVARFGQTGDCDLHLPDGRLLRSEGDLVPADEHSQQLPGDTPTAEVSYKGALLLVSQAPVTAKSDQVGAITTLDWRLVVDQDSAEALQPVDAAMRSALAVSLGALLGAVLLAFLVAQTISAPIRQLSATAMEIAAGEWSRRLTLQRRDEIGLLGSSFNTMADSLETQIHAEQAARAEAQRLQLIEVERSQVLERALADLHESHAQRDQLHAAVQELSSPVLRVQDGILVMPLIGAIDTERAMLILTTMLGAIQQHRARMIILDVTGVPVIDTQVARMLLQAADGARLLGAQMILVGLRPELAQTIVGLGLGLDQLVTQADLQSGVAYAMRRA